MATNVTPDDEIPSQEHEVRPLLSLPQPSPSYQLHDSSSPDMPLLEDEEHLPNEPLPDYRSSFTNRHVPISHRHPDLDITPAYTEHPDPILELYNAIIGPPAHYHTSAIPGEVGFVRSPSAGIASDQESALTAWRTYMASPHRVVHPPLKSVVKVDDRVVNNRVIPCFFAAIDAGYGEVIKLIIEADIVSANTRRSIELGFVRGSGNRIGPGGDQIWRSGETPLVRAIKSRNVAMVKLLLDLGADVNAFSNTVESYDPFERGVRTPLQLAALMGHFVLVKLLMEQYHADDSIVAPDGQIALRLAAENGHAEIVEYLPSRRAGGFRRWKFKNRASIARAKRAAEKIRVFIKFFVWDIEKFFLWTAPKHLIVKPISKAGRYCWDNKHRVLPWFKKQAALMPGRFHALGSGLMKIPRAIWSFLAKVPGAVWRGLVEIWKVLAKVPGAVWRFLVRAAGAIWNFATKTLPHAIKETSIWLWKFLTVSIPKAIGIIAAWLWNGVVSCAKGTWNILCKIVSLLSTVVAAIVTFFQRLTLADIWNGFVDVLRAIFVSFPQLLWSWIEKLGEVSYKTMKALFGVFGQIFWWIGVGLLWLVMYIPRQMGKIVHSIGESLARAGHEIRVWFNPKAR